MCLAVVVRGAIVITYVLSFFLIQGSVLLPTSRVARTQPGKINPEGHNPERYNPEGTQPGSDITRKETSQQTQYSTTTHLF